jgi:aspartate/methionine/tyrosine aminotransferase
MRTHAHSPYMRWAKLSSAAKYNLATSGVAAYPLAKLGISEGQLEITGPSVYGYAPLLDGVTHTFGVPRECVFTTAGTAMANHLALAATTEPGDEILVEQPTYELLLSTAKYLGLNIKRFQRPAEAAWQPDLDDLQRNLTPKTKLVVVTNLHNPSGVLITNEILANIGELAGKVGAQVLVDEVYLEMLYGARPPTALRIDPERFIVTSSLTKAYGLSGLRCGWVFASKKIVHRMWAINDLYSSTPVFPGEQMSVAAFQNLTRIGNEMKQTLAANRKVLMDFFYSRRDLEVIRPEHGTIAFPKLIKGSVEEFIKLLRDDFETSVVPGSFFESPQHFRVGVGGETEEVRHSLTQLGHGLDRFTQHPRVE